jgi:hypothetical protein
MKRLLSIAFLVLTVLGVAVTAAADAPGGQTLADIFARFDHTRHAKPLEKAGLGCTACHQVGNRGDPRIPSWRLDEAFLLPPSGACHFCHNPPAGEAEVGPGRCALCHDTVLPPSSHGAGWREMHGDEVLVGALECEDCHRRAFCIDCHSRRQRLDYRVHDRTWIAVHGIAARADPTDCGTCHLQSDCVQCHTTAEGRLP